MKLSVLRRQLFPYRSLVAGIMAIMGGIGLVIVGLKAGAPWATKLKATIDEKIRVIKILRDPTVALKTSEGRTNILVLGKGGVDHDAPDLTDSMMVVSLAHDDKNVSMISIPRDVWIDSMKAKINSAYYYGEQKLPGGGVILARDAVFQVTDLPIHYTLLVDFEGFKRAIDLVGGVDVEVERTFTDEKYPMENIQNYKGTKSTNKNTNGQNDKNKIATDLQEEIYETVHFEKGLQHMDGDSALKFARSRNSTDPEEGTDFARSRRQQNILIALANTLRQKETVLNIERIKELERLFRTYVASDLPDEALLALGRLGAQIDPKGVRTIGFDGQNADGLPLLVNPPVKKYGQWVLEPRTGSWEELHAYVKQELQR